VKLRWTRPALTDLEEIGDYIARDNPRAATELTRRIHDACENLRDFPGQGRAGRVAGTRELVIGGTPYIAAYTVLDGEVMILTVIHGARRWPEAF
jgi:toxin ParE1/3/4